MLTTFNRIELRENNEAGEDRQKISKVFCMKNLLKNPVYLVDPVKHLNFTFVLPYRPKFFRKNNIWHGLHIAKNKV